MIHCLVFRWNNHTFPLALFVLKDGAPIPTFLSDQIIGSIANDGSFIIDPVFYSYLALVTKDAYMQKIVTSEIVMPLNLSGLKVVPDSIWVQ